MKAHIGFLLGTWVILIMIVLGSCGDDDDDADPSDDDSDSDDDSVDDDDAADDDDDDDDDDDNDDDDNDDDDTIDEDTLVFIHHSVGAEWVRNGYLPEALANNGILFYEITYFDNWFGNNTDAEDWPITFTTYYDDVLGWELPSGHTHDLVMIKSCFPDSTLEPGELELHQGYYNQVLDVFVDHPETGFLVMTPPPVADNGEGTPEEITRGREFAYWLVNTWAVGVPNVRVVDLAGYLNDDQGFIYPRETVNAPHFYLRDECEREPDDSHPSGACLSSATPETVTAAVSLL